MNNIKIDKEELEKIILNLNPFKIPFGLGIIRPSNIVARYMPYSKSYSYGAKDLSSDIKSIVVYLFFTNRACDYYVRDNFTPRLISFMNRYFSGKTIYDNYMILRKEAAFLAGLGKIGRNSLLFSNKFGFNCKVDLLLTEIEFEDYCENKRHKDDYFLKYCRDCSECVASCPMQCSITFDLRDWEKCDQLITPQIHTPEKMCRNCIENCKYSEKACRETLTRMYKKDIIYQNKVKIKGINKNEILHRV